MEWPKNKFFDHYNDIIQKAKDGKWEKYDGYMENHHIIPRSLGGGNSKSNIVSLPAKYHYYAHYWLSRMFVHGSAESKSMIFGFHKMNSRSKNQKREINGMLFEEIRKKASEAQRGRKMTESNKEKLRIANKNKVISEESRKRMSESAKNRPPMTEEDKRKRTQWRVGTTDSVETKEKRAAHHRGAARSEQARENMRKGRRLAKLRRLQQSQTSTLDDSNPSVPNTPL